MQKQSGQYLMKDLLEQLRSYVVEHQESPHKAERRKNSGSETRKLSKQYKKTRSTEVCGRSELLRKDKSEAEVPG